MKQQLSHPDFLSVACPGGKMTLGGSQDWYAYRWRRLAGCGPTTASNIVWYMARSREAMRGLCETGSGDKAHFVRLMTEMFGYVTPGMKGVNTASMFTDGIVSYALAHGVAITPHVLEISRQTPTRPDNAALRDFILRALAHDAPVAFLNLHNGAVNNLDAWHWVTIIALDPDDMLACVTDQGETLDVDLAKWLRTSALGGALAYLTEIGI